MNMEDRYRMWLEKLYILTLFFSLLLSLPLFGGPGTVRFGFELDPG